MPCQLDILQDSAIPGRGEYAAILVQVVKRLYLRGRPYVIQYKKEGVVFGELFE